MLCFGESSLREVKAQDACFHVYVCFDNLSFLTYNVLSSRMGDILRGKHQPSRKGNWFHSPSSLFQGLPSLSLIARSYHNQREAISSLLFPKELVRRESATQIPTHFVYSCPHPHPSLSTPHLPSDGYPQPPTHNQAGSHQRPIYVLPIHSPSRQPASNPLSIVSSPPMVPPSSHRDRKKKPFVHESSTCVNQTHNTTIIHPAPPSPPPGKPTLPTHIALHSSILPLPRSPGDRRLRRSRQRRRWRTRHPRSRGAPSPFGLPSLARWRVS